MVADPRSALVPRPNALLTQLQRQLKDPALHEYTAVIIAGTDRLEALADALLGPCQRLRVFRGQVLDPEHPRCLAHLDALEQHPVEREEYRDLHDDRQAAGDGLIFSRL